MRILSRLQLAQAKVFMLFILSGITLSLLADAAPPTHANSTTFSGQATVLQASVFGMDPITVGDTGPLPPEGGAQEATLLEVEVPGVGTAQVAHASVVGQHKTSRAEASVANVDLEVAGHTIAADFLMSSVTARCQGGNAEVRGNSQIVNLVVDGEAITVEAAPNTEIPLVDVIGVPVGRIVINEQQSMVSGGMGEITVTALHIEIFGIADIVVARAYADINCPGGGQVGDFITGGGWITGTPTGMPANFGVAGGVKNKGLWGHLTYIDHGVMMHVKGTGVTAYTITGPTSRRIEGTARINGQDGFTYTVDVADNGEPGVDDTFAIMLSNGYAAAGTLVGGNIQLHVPQ